MSVRARIVPGDGDRRHGTTNGYRHHMCRCAECRAAWAKYQYRRVYERARSNLPVPHGTASGYTNYLCRCAECRAAWATYWRAYSSRRRAAVTR